ANLAVVEPAANTAPALVSNHVAGSPTTPAMTAPGAAGTTAASAPTFIILFGPQDQPEFAILVESVQSPAAATSEGIPSLATDEATDELRIVFISGTIPNGLESGLLRQTEVNEPANPGPSAPVSQTSTQYLLPAKSALVKTDVDPLLIPPGALNAVNLAQAPMPRAVEIPMPPPPVETAPPPREVVPAKVAENAISFAIPASAEESAIVAAPTTVAAAAASTTEALIPPAVEPPETASVSWGWYGAFAAALSVGGYWILHRSYLARLAKLSPRANAFLLKVTAAND
ncbi:MAG TPA: hypothetical protein VGL71_14865, partial [Urbifossiella sp.]